MEEVYYVSDPVRNVRRRRQTRVWKVEQFLGHGSFGQVRLERNHEDGQVRAVATKIQSQIINCNTYYIRKILSYRYSSLNRVRDRVAGCMDMPSRENSYLYRSHGLVTRNVVWQTHTTNLLRGRCGYCGNMYCLWCQKF